MNDEHLSLSRRAADFIAEMWDAVIEEEAILEESGTEPIELGAGEHAHSAAASAHDRHAA